MSSYANTVCQILVIAICQYGLVIRMNSKLTMFGKSVSDLLAQWSAPEYTVLTVNGYKQMLAWISIPYILRWHPNPNFTNEKKIKSKTVHCWNPYMQEIILWQNTWRSLKNKIHALDYIDDSQPADPWPASCSVPAANVESLTLFSDSWCSLGGTCYHWSCSDIRR